MNPDNLPLSRSTVIGFLQIPNTLTLNINYKKNPYYPTDSKNNTFSLTLWILIVANSRLMGNRGAQWRTEELSGELRISLRLCDACGTTHIPTAVYFAATSWDHSSPVIVKSSLQKVSYICKFEDPNISKGLNTGLLDTQLFSTQIVSPTSVLQPLPRPSLSFFMYGKQMQTYVVHAVQLDGIQISLWNLLLYWEAKKESTALKTAV